MLSLLQNILPFTEPAISVAGLVISIFIILPRLGSFIESIVNLTSGSLWKQPDIQAEKVAFIALGGSQVVVEKFTMASEDNANQSS